MSTLPRHPPNPAGLALAIAIGTVALCLAAFINGGPVMYPDTLNYLADGHGLIRLTTPDNTRPVFYGLFIEFLHWERTSWPVIIVQALLVALLCYLTARVLLARVPPILLGAILLALALLTPAAWYVAHLMPDIFTGVLVLAFFLLCFCRNDLGRFETLFLFLLLTASIGFHLTNLVTAAALCLAAWSGLLMFRGARPLLPSAALALTVLALLASSLALYHRLSLTPKSPPHFMARLIADGPGRGYLVATCPQTHYRLCADLDRLPNWEDGILWRYLAHLPAEDANLVRAQAGDVVHGTLSMFPLAVLEHMALNTLRQLVNVGSANSMTQDDWGRLTEPAFLVRDTEATLQRRLLLDAAAFTPINLLDAAVALLSALTCLVLYLGPDRPLMARWRSLAACVAVALLANAFASGALGGVFGRYQGRMIWLLPLTAMLGLALRQRLPAALTSRAAAPTVR